MASLLDKGSGFVGGKKSRPKKRRPKPNSSLLNKGSGFVNKGKRRSVRQGRQRTIEGLPAKRTRAMAPRNSNTIAYNSLRRFISTSYSRSKGGNVSSTYIDNAWDLLNDKQRKELAPKLKQAFKDGATPSDARMPRVVKKLAPEKSAGGRLKDIRQKRAFERAGGQASDLERAVDVGLLATGLGTGAVALKGAASGGKAGVKELLKQAPKKAAEGTAKSAGTRGTKQSLKTLRQKAGDKALTAQQKAGARMAARRGTRKGVIRRVTKKGAKVNRSATAANQATGAAVLGGSAAGPIIAATSGEDKAQRLATAPVEIGKAFAEAPGKTLSSSFKSARDMLVGLPQAAYEVTSAGVHLVQGDSEQLEQLADAFYQDLKQRYGPLLAGDAAEFRKRVQEESGVTPFMLDAMIVAPPASQGLGALARGGKLGKRAKEITEPGSRPALKMGEGAAKAQTTSRGLVGAAVQRAVDTQRAKKTDKRRQEGKPVAARQGKPEVEPLFPRAAQARDLAGRRGRAYISLTNAQAREIPRIQKAVSTLDTTQQRALKYAIQFGLRSPEQARSFLERHLSNAEAVRQAAQTGDLTGVNSGAVGFITNKLGGEIPKRWDELPVIRELIDNADTVFTQELFDVANEITGLERRLAKDDPALAAEQAEVRRYQAAAEVAGVQRKRAEDPRKFAVKQTRAVRKEAQAARVRGNTEREAELRGQIAALREARKQSADDADFAARVEGITGVKRDRGETNTQFIDRVRGTLEREFGITEAPGYVASETPRRGGSFAEYAVGGSSGASHIPGKYKARLLAAAVESNNPEVIIRGLARNIKRRENWNLVADIYDRYALKKYQGDRLQIMAQLENDGIDYNEVVLYDPKMLRREQTNDVAGDSIPDEAMADSELSATLRDISEATPDSTKAAAMFERTQGLSVLPRSVAEELANGIKYQSALGRVLGKGTGYSSRILLGANPPWLAFQVISNGILTGIAGVGPRGIIQAQRWWKSLDDNQRAAIEPYIGAGHHAADVRIERMGAANTRLPGGIRHFIDGYEAFRQTRAGRVRPIKWTLDAFFRADNAQNNFFRRAVLYNSLKKDTYGRMNRNWRNMAQGQENVLRGLKDLPRDQQLLKLVKNQDVLERHARRVNEFLGDYTSFTPFERGVLKRSVMFYGYLRFSLRFTFYTMPKRHPVMTALMAQLARIETEELRDLFGEDAPAFYFGNIVTDGGQIWDIRRANPVSNALVEAIGKEDSSFDPRAALGMLPPYLSHIFEQGMQQELFTGSPYTVEGESTPRQFLGIGIPDRTEIAARTALDMFFATRTWQEAIEGGADQSMDSIFGSEPTQYSPGGEADLRNQTRMRDFQKAGGGLGALRQDLFPLIPKPVGPMKRDARALSRLVREERRDLRDRPSGVGIGGSGLDLDLDLDTDSGLDLDLDF